MLQSLPAGRALSVTPDRGKEFSYHEQVTEAMKGMPFYFPKPHAPWERGTNENTNGLIREYSPKSYDMNNFDDDYFQMVADKLSAEPGRIQTAAAGNPGRKPPVWPGRHCRPGRQPHT